MNSSYSKHYFQIKGRKAERVVHDLAIKTFLTDWCYLNPNLLDGKELCDLLVVFDDVAIIWQIKDLKLNSKGRYRKFEIDKNLRQVSGAFRQLFDLKTEIILENPRRGREKFDSKVIKKVYLISVLLGQGEDFYSALESVKGKDVHIFSKRFTELVLNELNTISDFVSYLKEKENLFSKKRSLIITGGEEELLAFYQKEGKSFGKLEKADNIFLEGGIWDDLQKDKRYLKGKEADKISYGWDSIINRAHEGSSQYEIVARELARPGRFERRFLSKVFMDAHIKAHEDKKADLFRRIMPTNGVTYCFLFADDPDPKMREQRKAMLASICYFARGKFPKNHKVIGIATEKKFRRICSYDFVLLEKPEWTDDDQKRVDELQKMTGMFINPMIAITSEDEYPSS